MRVTPPWPNRHPNVFLKNCNEKLCLSTDVLTNISLRGRSQIDFVTRNDIWTFREVGGDFGCEVKKFKLLHRFLFHHGNKKIT